MSKGQILSLGLVLLLAALVLLFAGIGSIYYYDQEKENLISKGAVLHENSEAFVRWTNETGNQPRIEYIYVFNITNPEEVLEGQPVAVDEIGPFAYRVNQHITQVRFAPDGLSLGYTLQKSYQFDAEQSHHYHEDVNVTVVNYPMLSLIAKLRSMPNESADEKLKGLNKSLFIQIPVSQLLWGYEDTQLKTFNQDYRFFNDTVIGVLHQSNVSSRLRYMGTFEISSGMRHVNSVWNIITWNNNTVLPYWKEEESRRISGTSGYDWPPHLSSKEDLIRFDPDWCRSVHLTHTGHVSFDRLTTDFFHIPRSTWNYSLPENKGFCQETPDEKDCLYDGALNVSLCNTEEIPWILSQPHFYDADERYIKSIVNMTQPDADHHGNFVEIELTTGEVEEVHYRKQFNFLLTNQDIKYFKFVKSRNSSVLIPIAWIDEVYLMSSNERVRLTDFLVSQRINRRTAFGLIGFSIFVIVIIIVVILSSIVRLTVAQSVEDRRPLLLHY